MKIYILWLRGYYGEEDSIDSYWLNKESLDKKLKELVARWPELYGQDEWGRDKYYIEEVEGRL